MRARSDTGNLGLIWLIGGGACSIGRYVESISIKMEGINGTAPSYSLLDETLNGTVNATDNRSHIFERYSSWSEFYAEHAPAVLYIDRSITPIWYLFGIIGNTISAIVWSKRRMQHNNFSAKYLVALALSDLFFVCIHILAELAYAWGVPVLDVKGLCEAYFPLYYLPQCLSVLLVMGFTMERYISVCHPFKREQLCSSANAIRTICTMVAVSLMYAAPQAYFFYYDDDKERCRSRPDLDMVFWKAWAWSTEMVIYGVVPLVGLVLNMAVIHVIHRVSRENSMRLSVGSREQARARESMGGEKNNTAATTRMLLSISLFFIFTTLPATIVYVIGNNMSPDTADFFMSDEEIRTSPAWQNYLTFFIARKLVEEICLSHYACNFFIYMKTGTIFRNHVKKMLKTFLNKANPANIRVEYSVIHQGSNALRNACFSSKKATVGKEETIANV